MPRRLIFALSVVTLTFKSLAARRCLPPVLSSAVRIKSASKRCTSSVKSILPFLTTSSLTCKACSSYKSEFDKTLSDYRRLLIMAADWDECCGLLSDVNESSETTLFFCITSTFLFEFISTNSFEIICSP